MTTEVADETARAVFFPEPPAEPRLQFLKAYSAAEDLGGKGPGALDRVLFGEPERRDIVLKPYGTDIHDGKLYVCDVGRRMIEVFDLREKRLFVMTRERRLRNPMSIVVVDGIKYVSDPTAGAVFVFDEENELKNIIGQDLKIAPIDLAVDDTRCYVTDSNANQVVVMDRETGKELLRMGRAGEGEGQFLLISDLTLDQQGNVYVTDKAKGRITVFNRSGVYQRTIGRLGDGADELVRPKGIDVDRDGNIWLIDAAPEIAKIYDNQGRLLLFFGFPGPEPGKMNLPAKIRLDYDNVDLFQPYAVEGARLDALVVVSNQYGRNKINVYGFGSFPKP